MLVGKVPITVATGFLGAGEHDVASFLILSQGQNLGLILAH